MDYKRIIKDRNTRIRIIQFLNFIPDSLMVRIQYFIKTGQRLHLRNPQRYTEKLQWMKVYYRDDTMCCCADKYDVRKYVEEKGYGSFLNDLYGVYDSPDEIKFDSLPKSFVLKDTLGSGGNSMLFVYDKDKVDIEEIRAIIKEWVETSKRKRHPGREWVYDNRKHRIIAEKLLIGDGDGDLPDFKFFCFNGKPYCLYMMKNYTQHHEQGILGFLTPDFTFLPAHRKDFRPMTIQPEKPKNYDKMLEMASDLSKGFPHVRVDFYNIDGKIIFGEMTFFNASGYSLFEPDDFDYELGSVFKLPPRSKKD